MRHLAFHSTFLEIFRASASSSLKRRVASTGPRTFTRNSTKCCVAPWPNDITVSDAYARGPEVQWLHVGCGRLYREEQRRLLRVDCGLSEFRRRTTTAAGAMAGGQDGGAASINIAGKDVPLVAGPGVSESDVRKAAESNLLKQWIGYMTGHDGILTLGGSGGARCSLRQLTIQNVDYFGQRVGFVKFKAEVIDEKTGSKIPGIVFGRGGSVGILMLLECEGVKYAVLTEQARVPVGRTLLELPAGILDSDAGDFAGTAAQEIEEETGIKIKISDLVDLTALLDEKTGRKMLPSAGGSDETITLFLYRGHIKKEALQKLHGAETGLRDHGELIQVHVIPYSALWRSTGDAKALAAIGLYEMAIREGVLPPAPNAPELSSL